MGIRLHAHDRNGITDEEYAKKYNEAFDLFKDDRDSEAEEALAKLDKECPMSDISYEFDISFYKELINFLSNHIGATDNSRCTFTGCRIIDQEKYKKFWKDVISLRITEDIAIINTEMVLKYIKESETMDKEDKEKLIKKFEYHVENDFIVTYG